MPARFSRRGGNASPPLAWSEPPKGTRSLALIVVDLDTPLRLPVTHWIVFNIPPGAGHLEEGRPAGRDLGGGIVQGRNWARRDGYTGPEPPWGEHRYLFTLYALDIRLKSDPRLGRRTLRRAMKGHVLAAASLTGTFAR
jgi:Raf kinase inhibitor-like YbhB/YbcL family protein